MLNAMVVDVFMKYVLHPILNVSYQKRKMHRQNFWKSPNNSTIWKKMPQNSLEHPQIVCHFIRQYAIMAASEP